MACLPSRSSPALSQLGYDSCVAVTFSARAGGRFHTRVIYWQPGKTAVVDTTGYDARLEIRANRPPYRVVLSSVAWVPDDLEADPVASPPLGTPFYQIGIGRWEIMLGRSITRSLPPQSRFEVELVSQTDPDDVIPMFSGVLRINPEVVTEVISE
jgi:hypothetical protein